MAVPNFSRVLTVYNSPTTTQAREQASTPWRISPCKMYGIKRWNGHAQTYSDWDSLRRVSVDKSVDFYSIAQY